MDSPSTYPKSLSVLYSVEKNYLHPYLAFAALCSDDDFLRLLLIEK
jgi:hypothetical protein